LSRRRSSLPALLMSVVRLNAMILIAAAATERVSTMFQGRESRFHAELRAATLLSPRSAVAQPFEGAWATADMASAPAVVAVPARAGRAASAAPVMSTAPSPGQPDLGQG